MLNNKKQARGEFLKRKEKLTATQKASDQTSLKKGQNRLAELARLLTSVYANKVLGKIPEEVCISFLDKYSKEKATLKTEIEALERKIHESKKEETDVDEFIRRIKTYVDIQELTRKMCLELIEYITIDAFPSDDKKRPREIHIYYKLIDKKKTLEQTITA